MDVTRHIDAAEYLFAAAAALGADPEDLLAVVDLNLLESALHAPQAGMFDREFYPTVWEKASVLCSRLARNHCLPNGNKRAAWMAMRQFMQVNGLDVVASAEEAEAALVALAIGSPNAEGEFAEWLRERAVAYIPADVPPPPRAKRSNGGEVPPQEGGE